jgi:BON domain
MTHDDERKWRGIWNESKCQMIGSTLEGMKIRKLFTSIAFLIALVGSPIACSRHPNDDTITKDIQTKVAADPETKDSDVVVATTNAKVKLTGPVKTPAAKQKVEQIAREEPGVADVDDETAVQRGTQAAQGLAPVPPPVEKSQAQPIVVPAGATLTVRVGQALGSRTSQPGQTFLATLAQPVSIGGRTAIPAGAIASGTVVTAKAKGKIKGEGELTLALTSVMVRGQTYTIQTRVLENTTKGKGKRTAATTGGGAAGGALIGGLAGGGKGAGIGALVGAGAGLIGGAMTGNQQIEIPAESALSFRLSVPLTLPPPGE